MQMAKRAYFLIVNVLRGVISGANKAKTGKHLHHHFFLFYPFVDLFLTQLKRFQIFFYEMRIIFNPMLSEMDYF